MTAKPSPARAVAVRVLQRVAEDDAWASLRLVASDVLPALG